MQMQRNYRRKRAQNQGLVVDAQEVHTIEFEDKKDEQEEQEESGGRSFLQRVIALKDAKATAEPVKFGETTLDKPNPYTTDQADPEEWTWGKGGTGRAFHGAFVVFTRVLCPFSLLTFFGLHLRF